MTQQDLVGIPELAVRLGVPARNIHRWRDRHKQHPPHRHPWQPFPDPVMNISGRPVWQWADVKRWARETGRLD